MYEKQMDKVNKLLAEKGIKPIPSELEPYAPITKPPSPHAQTGKAAAHVEEPAATPTQDDVPTPAAPLAPDMTPAQLEKPATVEDIEAPADDDTVDEAPAAPATTEELAASSPLSVPSPPPSPVTSPLAADFEKQ
ncbi:hypothetical protein U1Q18_039542 [Sarracenia purpurea var. burkii]